jgi:hypothetical protein
MVNLSMENLNLNNFASIVIKKSDLISSLKDMQKSFVCGNEYVSSIMILSTGKFFVSKFLLIFFQYIFKHCVIPNNFTISHIVPIIKDKKKYSADLNNLRPISISNCLAQLFHCLLLLQMPEIK